MKTYFFLVDEDVQTWVKARELWKDVLWIPRYHMFTGKNDEHSLQIELEIERGGGSVITYEVYKIGKYGDTIKTNML